MHVCVCVLWSSSGGCVKDGAHGEGHEHACFSVAREAVVQSGELR